MTNLRQLVSFIVFSFLLLRCNDVGVDINYQNPCFERDIVPLVKRDCAKCHENGEYSFKVIGSSSDYDIIVSYSDINSPENSLILEYAVGRKHHPKIWKEGSKEYLAFYNWVESGAKKECLRENLGECQVDEDCMEITCICPDMNVIVLSKCFKDDNNRGTCIKDSDCDLIQNGICTGDKNDAGVSDVIQSDVNDISFEDSDIDFGFDVYDTGIIDYDVYTDTGDDSGLRDAGIDIGFDSGYDTGMDTGGNTSISFSSQIVPLIKTDCKSCHYAGQYGVKLTGTSADYSEVMRYVDINDPEGAYGFLWWASGGGGHPNKWQKGGAKYNLFLRWVQEGAKNN